MFVAAPEAFGRGTEPVTRPQDAMPVQVWLVVRDFDAAAKLAPNASHHPRHVTATQGSPYAAGSR